jgi:hypothetical protein
VEIFGNRKFVGVCGGGCGCLQIAFLKRRHEGFVVWGTVLCNSECWVVLVVGVQSVPFLQALAILRVWLIIYVSNNENQIRSHFLQWECFFCVQWEIL